VPSNLDQVRAELDALCSTGARLALDLLTKIRDPEKDGGETFLFEYEEWYTESQRVVAQLVPERLPEFAAAYRLPGRKSVSYETYTISDYLHGTAVMNWDDSPRFDVALRAVNHFQTQNAILRSASKRFESSLMDLRDLVQADLFDDELQKCRALHKQGLLREAGVVAGVVLEGHLQNVASQHKIRLRRKAPTISDLNDPLKQADVYDVPTWRHIQRLADIRNLCDHRKERDPIKEEVLELIDGVDKVTKTIF
jgi:hypothetical protein